MSATSQTPNLDEARETARAWFAEHAPARGLGNLETGEACTIAALHLALTGKLSDGDHPCVCPVIRRWVIRIQDAMPASVRESREWRDQAHLLIGSRSTREAETARRGILLDEMWRILGHDRVVAAVPGKAREAWQVMLTERTSAAAYAAYAASDAAYAAYAASAASDAAYAASAASDAAYAAYAASAASDAAYAAYAASDASDAAYAAYAASDDADAASDASDEVWSAYDPPRILARLLAEGSGQG